MTFKEMWQTILTAVKVWFSGTWLGRKLQSRADASGEAQAEPQQSWRVRLQNSPLGRFWRWLTGFKTRWNNYLQSEEHQQLKDSLARNWAWFTGIPARFQAWVTGLSFWPVLVKYGTYSLVILAYLIAIGGGWGASDNQLVQMSKVEVIVLGVYGVVSFLYHLLMKRGLGKAIVYTAIQLGAYILSRGAFHVLRYSYMRTQTECLGYVTVGWVVGWIAWMIKDTLLPFLDGLFWRIRLIADMWQQVSRSSPIFKWGMNIAAVFVGGGYLIQGLTQSPWALVVAVPILFVWLVGIGVKPPTEEQKAQRAAGVTSQAAHAEHDHDEHADETEGTEVEIISEPQPPALAADAPVATTPEPGVPLRKDGLPDRRYGPRVKPTKPTPAEPSAPADVDEEHG